ncbi:hypothetical protein TVAG_173840 [Trichomonas vaginalis G3]|uniref:Uncharacterized protein n=1 Tax=Trichomonas vaginalis (strain ATCC PRA-98 / G3) TaxID=412133 RepID=A2EVK6_TRIV3|nr:nucleotide-diphospho-sugar transferases family [Trichomonas vaginalis G3]EAY03338.1 hypothetical protein TVAG_173840 [Trichomonas vaginalis G3]KAI5498313.1 nucleotide-diphospho-sugar transferases family [Trichomonas vaginalis G3]|eukprot:XP_001315561.1 hypothetical protein [Trichomonas vaginalis G3]
MKYIDPDPEYKMHPFIKNLPRPVRKFVLKYCNSTTLLILGVIVFLIIIPVLTQRHISELPYGINNVSKIDPRYSTILKYKHSNLLSPLSIYFRKSILDSFTPYVQNSDDKCINRTNYAFEQSRLLGINPYEKNLSDNYFLIIGSNTEIGSSLEHYAKNEHIPTIGIGCQNFLDFSSSYATRILKTVRITRGVVSCPVDQIMHNDDQYIQGISRYFKSNNIPFTFIFEKIPNDSISKIINDFGGQIIKQPNLLSNKNLASQAYHDCLKSHHSEVTLPLEDEFLWNIHDFQFCKFVMEQLDSKSNRDPYIIVEGSKKLNLKKAIKDFANPNGKCSISFYYGKEKDYQTFLSYKVHKIDGQPNAFNNFAKNMDNEVVKRPPYISFVIAFQNETSRTQKLLNSIANNVNEFKINDFEVILVGNDKFEYLPLELQGHTTQIKYNIPMNLIEAKNVGLFRASGEFIAVVDANVLLRDIFFQAIKMRDFNPYVLYKSVVTTDLKEYKFKFMRNIAQYSLEKYGDGFFMASKLFWESVGGFPEFENYDTDNFLISKAMKLIPGYGLYNVDKFVSIQDSYLRKMKFVDDSDSFVRDLFCWGESKKLSKKYDLFTWGHQSYKFDELIL